MKDIAKAAGVSLATISRVFNDSDKVTSDTRKHVLKVAEQLDYRPNKMASALRSGKSKSIGIVVPVIDREVFSSAIKSIEEVLSAAGYNIIICQSHESYQKEQEIIGNLKQLNVAGIIMSISKETDDIEHLDVLRRNNIPIIFFDRSLEFGAINSVVINNYNGAYKATKHLIDQSCKKIIHLAGKQEVAIFRERRRGFEAALKANGFVVDEKLIIPFDNNPEEGITALKKLLQSKERPDGILAHGDIAALVASRIINELNIKIPQEIAIVGFGDNVFCTYLEPSLSSVNQRNEDVGKLAANILLNEIKNEGKEGVVVQQMLPPILKIRKSSLR